MENLKIDDKTFEAYKIPTQKVSLLIIKGSKGMLACGYLSMDAADKFGDALAIVRGVASFDDMLAKEVCELSDEAEALGLKVGMTGKDALLLMA